MPEMLPHLLTKVMDQVPQTARRVRPWEPERTEMGEVVRVQ